MAAREDRDPGESEGLCARTHAGERPRVVASRRIVQRLLRWRRRLLRECLDHLRAARRRRRPTAPTRAVRGQATDRARTNVVAIYHHTLAATVRLRGASARGHEAGHARQGHDQERRCNPARCESSEPSEHRACVRAWGRTCTSSEGLSRGFSTCRASCPAYTRRVSLPASDWQLRSCISLRCQSCLCSTEGRPVGLRRALPKQSRDANAPIWNTCIMSRSCCLADAELACRRHQP